MKDFTYLMKFSKPMLVTMVINQVQNECGKLFFSQWHKLFKRLNRENKLVLQNLIIASTKNNSFMADEITKMLNFKFDY